MTDVCLEHPFTTAAHELHLFGDLHSLGDLIHRINAVARREYSKDAEAQNRLKGDAFEVFGEYLIKLYGAHPDVAIVDYTPNSNKDLGVDGTGRGLDGGNAAVQIKFRSNVHGVLSYPELATFGNDALARHGILSPSTARALREQGYDRAESSMHNMLVLSTTINRPSFHFEEVNQGFRFLGYNQLEKLTRSAIFWTGLERSVAESAQRPRRRVYKKLYRHQIEALEEISHFLKGESDRGQVIIPCGGGKTLIELGAVEACLSGGSLAVILAPRIDLVAQLYRQFHAGKRAQWGELLVNSGPGVEREYFFGENPYRPEPTTDQETIDKKVGKSQEGEKVAIFATYHSAHRIAKALRTHDTRADITICDEAHNLVRRDFHPLLKEIQSKKWLFLTATRVVGTYGEGRGMDNERHFGQPLKVVRPRELQELGLTVPPRLHLMSAGSLGPGEHDHEENDQLALIVAGALRHEEEVSRYKDSSARIIAFCRSADDAHDFEESEVLKRLLPGFYLCAITSKEERMRGKRRDIFEKFAGSERAILFNYSVVGEGIDIPGVTGILPLRGMNPTAVVQAVGRACRALPADQKAVETGEITPGSSRGWEKPFGWVLVPLLLGDEDESWYRLKAIVWSLRDEGYDLEESIHVQDRPRGRALPEPEFDTYGPPEYNDLFGDQDTEGVRTRAREILHEVEEERQLRIKGYDVARDWARENGIESPEDWQRRVDNGTLPDFLPEYPEQQYRGRGWSGWTVFLGRSPW